MLICYCKEQFLHVVCGVSGSYCQEKLTHAEKFKANKSISVWGINSLQASLVWHCLSYYCKNQFLLFVEEVEAIARRSSLMQKISRIVSISVWGINSLQALLIC